ncbi:MAG TPA: aminotransferase class V-fold PLP-dependent enzyme, partial [Coxiellaceae bacterium]|nr:aminotransferase class V-fold PLP-dependent enzyme [Coxiellaceae bacterium]
RYVTFDKTEFNVPPQKFEAGTPNMAGVVGLGAAIDFVTQIGFDAIQTHEKKLLIKVTEALSQFSEIKIYGASSDKLGVIAFGFSTIHPHDIATILDQSHIAVRAGHHCAMPLMDYLKVPALSRVSFGLYNELSDVDALVNGLKMVREVFGDQ